MLARQARMASSVPAAEQKKQWTAGGRAKRSCEAHNLSYKFLIQNQRVGVCQIVTPVGALRQNPSNAPRQIRPESGPTTSRQMLSSHSLRAPQIAHSSHTVTAHTVTSTHSGKYTSRVVALAFAARASPPPCLATIRARSRRCSITFSWPDVGAPRSLS